MNILLINHYAGSTEMGMEFRPYYFAREWVKAGHHVNIIAGDYSHLRRQNPHVEQDFQKEEIDGISYHWIRTGEYDGNGIKRAFTMFRFVGKLWLHAGKIVKEMRPDVVIASSTYPLDTYAAQRIAKKAGAQLIHEVHDMWPITLIELGGMSKWNPFVILMQMAENSFCKNSDIVCSLPGAAKDYFIKHGMKEENFRHIPNGIVKEEWEHYTELPQKYEDMLEQLKREGKFTICFFGSHTESYALTYLIEAIEKTQCIDICAVFVGNGTQKEYLIKSTEKLRSQFVFFDPIPKSSIPALVAKVDAIYVGALKNDMFRFGICMNKLFDAMMSGKPILYAVEAPNNYILDYQCGVSVEAQNSEKLAEGLLKIFNMTDTERRKMGQNGRQAVLEHFEYSILANDFLNIMKKRGQ